MRQRKGIATLLVVILVSIVSLFILLTWQARLVLAIQRYQSLSDLLIVNYRGESTIYDWVAKFLGTYPNIYNPPIADCSDFTCAGSKQLEEILPNKLLVVGKKVGDSERLEITATRPYASTNFQLTRKKTTSAGFKHLDTVLSLDCTGSMNYPANNSCFSKCGGCDEGSCVGPGGSSLPGSYSTKFANYKTCMVNNGCVSRMSALKTAAVKFSEDYKSFQDSYVASHPSSDIRLSLVLFRVNADNKQPLTTNITSIVDLLKTGLSDYQTSSSLCQTTQGWTSIGTGFDVANEIHRTNVGPNKKQVTVVITDGEPNSRNAPANPLYCTGQTCCPGLSGCPAGAVLCANDAIPFEFLRCSLKDTIDGGSRASGVDNYAVTTLDFPSEELSKIFQEEDGYDYVKRYFNAPDATKLDEILADILNSVVTGFQEIKIEKVIPNP